MKLKSLFVFTLILSCNSSLLAEECKYKKEYINADLNCNGNGDCMLARFQALTSYEGGYDDYMDCWAWSVNKRMGY